VTDDRQDDPGHATGATRDEQEREVKERREPPPPISHDRERYEGDER
jgi:hypothetical protein